MKLIVGLGNPGSSYATTKHNMGFIIIDEYLKKHNITLDKKKFNGEYTITSINNQEVLILKPQSFMNLSGGVVREFISYFKIDIKDILIISDDLDLPLFKLRLKQNGSSGGHNGLKDIEENLKTKEYKRLKVGIDRNINYSIKDYVLSKFTKLELDYIHENISKSLNILDDFLVEDFNKLMSKYN